MVNRGTRSRIVVAGVGLLAPGASDAKGLFAAALRAENRIGLIRRFDASAYPCGLAGEIGEIGDRSFGKRVLKKLDRFSHFSLITARDAMEHARVDLEREDRTRIGVFLGNALGGWQFAEENLRAFYKGGLRDVSPYMATAWFPAAPQGQVSIHFGLRGYSKTVVADRTSSLVAIGYAARAIRTGRVEAALAGGAEAPVTPYALLCCSTSGQLAATRNGNGDAPAYLPYDEHARGYVLGEGASFLWLETAERARARGATALGTVAGFGAAKDAPGAPTGEGLARAIRLALAEAGAAPSDVGAVYGEGAALPADDAAEDRALGEVFERTGGGPPVTAPRSGFGALLGAAGAVDVALALETLATGKLPPIVGTRRITPALGRDYVLDRPRECGGAFILVCSRGDGGTAAAILIGRGDS